MQPYRDQSGRELRNSRARLGLGMGIMGLLALTLASCLPSQWSYLGESTDRATQEEVTDRLGTPLQTKSLEDEGSLWVYRYEVRSSLVGRRGDMVGGAPCIEYLLTFDGKKVLRYWTRQHCGMVQAGASLPGKYDKSGDNGGKL